MSQSPVQGVAAVATQRIFWSGVACGASIYAGFGLFKMAGPLSEIRSLFEESHFSLTPFEQLATHPAVYLGVPFFYLALVFVFCLSLSRRLFPPVALSIGLAGLGLVLAQVLSHFALSPLRRVAESFN